MAQAKTLNPDDLATVLAFINTQRYATRNRAMMLLTHWAGLRIGEVAALRWMDVVTHSGQIKDEIRLLSRMTGSWIGACPTYPMSQAASPPGALPAFAHGCQEQAQDCSKLPGDRT